MEKILLFSLVPIVLLFLIYKISKRNKRVDSQRNSNTPLLTIPKPSIDSNSRVIENQIDKNIIEQNIILQEELSEIIETARKFAFELDVHNVCSILLDEVERRFFVQKCVLLLFDNNSKQLYVDSFRGIEGEQAIATIKALRLNIGESISGLVARNRSALFIRCFEKETYYYSINKEPYFSGSFISMPIIAKDDLLGVVNVINKKSGKQFSEDDLKFLGGVISVASTALKNAQLNKQVQGHYINVIITLAKTLDAKDHYTKSHSENVDKFSVLIAKEMGLSLSEIEEIHRAALLHDIGKIAIPDSILLKPSGLTEVEYEIVKSHPVHAEEIISSIFFLQNTAKIIRHHHERYDGKGYPDGIAGEKIELGSRIIGVADALDAMTSDRPYRDALSLSEAAQQLEKGKGTQFDPNVADVMLKIIKEKPHLLGISSQ